MAKSGYCNGSDMLLYIGDKAIGSCTSHSVNLSSETKDRAVKPVASAGITAGLWKKKGVTGLSVSISAEGLVFYNETEFGYRELIAAWKTGQPVNVKCIERHETTSQTSQPYLTGSFVIASVDRTDPAQDDATYSISLENNGEVTIDETKITEDSEG